MKLSQLYNGRKLINEGSVDINIILSLRNVIRDKAVTDLFQYIAIARMIELIKDGHYQIGNFYEPSLSTSKAILDELKATPPEVLVQTAENLLMTIELIDKEPLKQYYCPDDSYSVWMNKFINHVNVATD